MKTYKIKRKGDIRVRKFNWYSEEINAISRFYLRNVNCTLYEVYDLTGHSFFLCVSNAENPEGLMWVMQNRNGIYNVIKNNERKKEEFEINYQNISIWVFPDEDILTECAIKEIRDALKSPDDYDYWFEPYDCFDPDGYGKPD